MEESEEVELSLLVYFIVFMGGVGFFDARHGDGFLVVTLKS